MTKPFAALLLFLLILTPFSRSIAQDELSQTATSADGRLTIRYPLGWEISLTTTIALANSPEAMNAHQQDTPLPPDAIIFTFIQPAQLPEAGLSETADPTEAVETLVNLGGMMGHTKPYPAVSVPAATAYVRGNGFENGQLVALAFETGTIIVGIETAREPSTAGDTVALILNGLSYNAQTENSDTATDTALSNPGGLTFQWITTAPSDGSAFNNIASVTAAPGGMVYALDSANGIWVIDPATGATVDHLQLERRFMADGITYDPTSGNLFIASWVENSIFEVSPVDGRILNQIGSAGPGEGEFGTFSPQTVVVRNGEIYATDSNEDADGNKSSRIQIFDLNGNFLRAIDTTSLSTFEPTIAIAPNGNIYVGGFALGTSIFAPDGSLLEERFAENALFAKGVSALDIDPNGNIYVATRNAGLMVLSPDGTLLGEYGEPTPSTLPDDYSPSLGEYGTLNGVAVINGTVYISDNFNGKASAITALVPAGTTNSSEATSETPTDDVIRQWASSATGTSEYGNDGWGFVQALGAPNTDTCGDHTTAWASSSSTGNEMLMLEFVRAVMPTQVDIYQTYTPGSITHIELVTISGETIVVPGSADPPGNTSCPGVFSVAISGISSPVNGVNIYFDQSIGGSWNEIDAVELIGIGVPQ